MRSVVLPSAREVFWGGGQVEAGPGLCPQSPPDLAAQPVRFLTPTLPIAAHSLQALLEPLGPSGGFDQHRLVSVRKQFGCLCAGNIAEELQQWGFKPAL